MESIEELRAENAALREQLAAAERARDEIAAERDLLRAALMHIPAMIAILEGPEHVMRFVNPLWEGVAPGREVVGRRAVEVLPELVETGLIHRLDEVYTTGATFEGAVSSGQTGFSFRTPLFTFQYLPMRDEGGEIFGVLFHAVNLAEQERMLADQQAIQEQLIATQQQAIRELSTPLIPLADRLVVMPLVGTIDQARAGQILETLLQGISAQQAAVAILDVTGIRNVDEGVASALLKTAHAARLLGTEVVLTGISPDVARTLVEIGADLGDVTTHGTLQAGVAHAMTRVTSSRPRRARSSAPAP